MAFLLWCAVVGTLFFLLAAALEWAGLLEDDPSAPGVECPCAACRSLPRRDWSRAY